MEGWGEEEKGKRVARAFCDAGARGGDHHVNI